MIPKYNIKRLKNNLTNPKAMPLPPQLTFQQQKFLPAVIPEINARTGGYINIDGEIYKVKSINGVVIGNLALNRMFYEERNNELQFTLDTQNMLYGAHPSWPLNKKPIKKLSDRPFITTKASMFVCKSVIRTIQNIGQQTGYVNTISGSPIKKMASYPINFELFGTPIHNPIPNTPLVQTLLCAQDFRIKNWSFKNPVFFGNQLTQSNNFSKTYQQNNGLHGTVFIETIIRAHLEKVNV